MNAAEDRLAELMDAATRALNPPLEPILAEAERRGRVRRRRRRAALAGGTVAAVLLAAGGTVVGVRATSSRPVDVTGNVPTPSRTATALSEARPPATVPNTGSVSASPSPNAKTPPGQGTVPINSTAAVKILRQLVAAKWAFGTYSQGGADSLLDVDVDDGKGLAHIFVGVAPASNPGMDPIDCSLQAPLLKGGGTRPAGAPPPSCNISKTANGDMVMAEVLKADAYGDYEYRVITSRNDGVAVEITAANGDFSNRKTEMTRVAPPLSLGAWVAVALSRMWRLDVAVSLAE